jgi:transcriptional regulator with XRE-family HTH domain
LELPESLGFDKRPTLSFKRGMVKITIQDVAQKAGVSVATIDRVLNRRPGVKTRTVEKVESAIRELNYQPDRIAARLARGREYRFWFVLPNTAGEFMTRVGAADGGRAGFNNGQTRGRV